MAALWWKFAVPGSAGTHLLRAKDLGAAGQQVWLDGVLLEAPEGTLLFTGPGAVLMQFQQSAAEPGWDLLIEGVPAERYNPDAGPLESPAVAWWKFPVQGMGTHHVRVTDIGTAEQTVFLDGTPLDAPPGTMTFTGPAASLLELQQRDNRWVLVVDGGSVFHQHNPNADPSSPLLVWNFSLPSTGSHQLRVANMGASGQEIYLDNTLIPAPEGTTTFTGPAGALLELRRQGSEWILLVDGVLVEAGGSGQTGGFFEAGWTFFSPITGQAHQVRVANIGRTGQEFSIDGVVLPAPDGTTTFTGPGGALLEIRPAGHAWSLFVDGIAVEDFNARASTQPGQRVAVDTSILPQGVSYDAESKVYKANIKVGGKFRFLGDFPTAQEAHERYLKAKQELGG